MHMKRVLPMPRTVRITRKEFLEDRQGRTFSDVLDDPEQPFDEVLAFFNDLDRQRRMEESETHHDRPALAGVIRELEAQPAIAFLLPSTLAAPNACDKRSVWWFASSWSSAGGERRARRARWEFVPRWRKTRKRLERTTTPVAWHSGSCAQSATNVSMGCPFDP